MPHVLRLLILVSAPAVATFLTWWSLMGRTVGDYSVGQCAATVLVLVAIGTGLGLLARSGLEVGLMSASAVVGISAACWVDWSDDETGLFVIGWTMITTAALVAAPLVIGCTWAIADLRRQPQGPASPR